MNRILKKTLSIILTVLMIVTMAPLALAADGDACTVRDCIGTYADGICTVCGGDGKKTEIDLATVADSNDLYLHSTVITSGHYGDPDGYILTGTGENVQVINLKQVTTPFDVVFRDVTLNCDNVAISLGDFDSCFTFEGTNVISGYPIAVTGGKSITINGTGSVEFKGCFASDVDNSQLNVESGNVAIDLLFVTVEVGVEHILNVKGGTVKICNSINYPCQDVFLHNGTTLIMENSRANICKPYSGEIKMADGVAENSRFIVKNSLGNEIAIVSDLSAFDDSTYSTKFNVSYLELTLDAHDKHSYTDSECLCGHQCYHESFTNGICDECSYECDHNYDIGDCMICGEYIYAITHQPTSGEPYVELNDDADATYQWHAVEISGTEITDENADTVVYDWGESSYDAETGWTGVLYDEEGSGYDFFTVGLEAGETVSVELTGDLGEGVGLWDYDVSDGVWVDAEEGVTSYELTVGADGNYTFYTVVNSGVVTVKAYGGITSYTEIEGETSAELKNPEFGKRYACEVTYGDGTNEMSDVFKYSYAITHQPTTAEPYVELNDDTDASYQWYSIEGDEAEITEENAKISLGTYKEGVGWVPTIDTSMNGQCYFVVALKAGDTVNFEFSSAPGMMVFDGSLIESDETTYTYVAQEDGDYELNVYYGGTEITVRAYLNGMSYVKIEGETGSAIAPTASGKYACKVTFADGTTEMSDIMKAEDGGTSEISEVTYTPSADTHNTFTVTVDGRPTMIQFIEEDGGTRTYDRNNKNVTITTYDADGNEVNSLDRTAAYEVWTIYTNLIGPAVKMRAKFVEGTTYKWEKNTYNFTLEFAEPVYDTEIYESYLEPVTKKGPAKIVLVTGADVQGIQFKMPNGTTTTYYADGAEVLEDGKLEFTGKVWMNESGENRIEIYVRSQNTWTYYGYFNHTVE